MLELVNAVGDQGGGGDQGDGAQVPAPGEGRPLARQRRRLVTSALGDDMQGRAAGLAQQGDGQRRLQTPAPADGGGLADDDRVTLLRRA